MWPLHSLPEHAASSPTHVSVNTLLGCSFVAVAPFCSALLYLLFPFRHFFSSHYFHSKNALLSPFLFLSSPLTLGLLLHCDVLCLCTSLTGASAAVSSCYIMLMLYVSWRMLAPVWNGDVREHVRLNLTAPHWPRGSQRCPWPDTLFLL